MGVLGLEECPTPVEILSRPLAQEESLNNKTLREKTRLAKRFIVAWQKAETLNQVCHRLHMTSAQARFRAHWYRRRGVPLKPLHNRNLGEFSYDWDALARLAKRSLRGRDRNP